MKAFNLKKIIGVAIGLTALVIWNGGAELAAQEIKITYPKPPANYTIACVGDTILVEATAPNIEDLILPKGTHWSGDADEAVISKTANTITKRFYTYHPYLATNPEEANSRSFDFTIKYNGTTETIPQTVVAKSCPPTLNTPQATLSSNGGKYNLGNIPFEFAFINKTSDVGILITPEFEPDQPFRHLSKAYNNANDKQWNIRYQVIQTSNADYTVQVRYNEGDSTKYKTFGPYNIPLIEQLGTLKPDATAYCKGNPIEFSLELSPAWQNVMNQTIENDESKIGNCFDWTGSPAPVSFDRRVGNKYFFKTTAAGTATDDFHCKMSVLLWYWSTPLKPVIDTNFTVQYNLSIQPVQYTEAKGFAQHEISVCQNDVLSPSLTQLTDGATVQEYLDGNGNKINTPGHYIATKSEEISAIITDPCPWTDKLKVNVIDESKIQSITPSSNILICEGETVSFSATANSPITWTITEGGNMDSWDETEAGKVYERSFTNNATILAGVSQCGNNFQTFEVQVVPQPDVKINAATHNCPYAPVNLSGAGGNDPSYTLYDLRAGRDITSEMQAYISPATGLTAYPMRPNDSLRLTYTAGITGNAPGFTPATLTCSKSAEAKIIAYPLPPLGITYGVTAYPDNGTACVPREAAFSLTASGADTYKWLDDPAFPTSAGRNLELAKDSTVRVRGVENTNKCFDTVSLNCVVSVEHANRVKSEAACPGNQVCFEADNLPNTTYAWYGPDNKPLNVSAEKLCQAFTEGQDGTYTLKTQRLSCTESLPYTLTLYPAPQIAATANSPLCAGEALVINYNTGLPAGTQIGYEFTKDGKIENIAHPNGDLFLYSKPDVQPTDEGRYILTVKTVDHSCEDKDTIDVTVEVPALVRIALSADTACEGEAGRLVAEVTPPGNGYIYAWSVNGRPLSESLPSIDRNWVRNDRDIRLTVHQKVCTVRADTAISVIPVPILAGMPEDTGVCQGLSICLNPVSDIPPQEIVWHWINNSGKHTQIPMNVLQLCQDDADESMNGRYYVETATLLGSKRCKSFSDTTRLTVHPTPDLRIEGPDFICDGETVTLTAVSRIADTVRWKHNGATTPAVSIDKAGQYTATGISVYGCLSSADITLEARPLPYFSLPPDTSICRGTSIMVYGPDGMDAYQWNDGSRDKDISAEKGGWYILTVYRNECPYSDSLYIHMSFCGQFHFPTAFSPNDNRVNDSWGAISAAKDEDMAEYDLMVFDRNGKKVFHGKHISEQWDGRYKGEPCPPGVYMYSFKALEKLEGIKYQASGTVTIVQ